jgi:hypothetical protein
MEDPVSRELRQLTPRAAVEWQFSKVVRAADAEYADDCAARVDDTRASTAKFGRDAVARDHASIHVRWSRIYKN